ncbi:MAG: hypothetical protein WCP45_18695 [Verrucomicrobiota bacterium]
MSNDLQQLEATLEGLHPSALDRDLLARLEDAANGTLGTSSPAEMQLETSLRRMRPAALPPSLMATLEATLGTTAATLNSTIIPFPQSPPADVVRTRHGRRPMFAAAAAVALLGALAALYSPGKGPRPLATSAATSPQAPVPTAATPSPASQNFVPAGFNTGLSQASDEGVVWQTKDQPRRVVKVVYWDRVTFVNPEGKKIEYEKPRVEYLLVPEKID